ncbi:hypothetical protein B0H17DRAFT_1340357 [Mycena rosella]|uniref:Uncharacterized protein n=1 Tax=Mycena rosella TaxID=1033263 RepID=A0AAD7BMH1_MYCRO|nr:hypothetical protein B0H17DRAFT_1340357 [Mycena rosella]
MLPLGPARLDVILAHPSILQFPSSRRAPSARCSATARFSTRRDPSALQAPVTPAFTDVAHSQCPRSRRHQRHLSAFDIERVILVERSWCGAWMNAFALSLGCTGRVPMNPCAPRCVYDSAVPHNTTHAAKLTLIFEVRAPSPPTPMYSPAFHGAGSIRQILSSDPRRPASTKGYLQMECCSRLRVHRALDASALTLRTISVGISVRGAASLASAQSTPPSIDAHPALAAPRWTPLVRSYLTSDGSSIRAPATEQQRNSARAQCPPVNSDALVQALRAPAPRFPMAAPRAQCGARIATNSGAQRRLLDVDLRIDVHPPLDLARPRGSNPTLPALPSTALRRPLLKR